MSAPIAVGEIVSLAPGVARVTAPNAGPMTGEGTNTYIVGTGPVAIIDPGVDDPAHLDAILRAAGGTPDLILLTHRHPDHIGGARALAETTGAPICALPKPSPGVHDAPVDIDRALADGERLACGDITLEVLHTPGHAADHACFLAADQGLLFAGDCVMADVTVVILPPDGHMNDYLDSIARLQTLAVRRIAPGHGQLLDAPAAALAHIVAHRLEREAQIHAELDAEAGLMPAAVVDRLYPNLDTRLKSMAATQVEAHLIRLAEHGRAECSAGGWRLASEK